MPKPKTVSYRRIEPDSKEGRPIYKMLHGLVESHHEELTNAKIALAWNYSWQPDVDGRVTLGKCKKASDLDREFVSYDFVILLRAEWWEHPQVDDAQRLALLDHELTHATVKLDESGEPARDQRGRVVYRIRKHDIEEFIDVVNRHGVWQLELKTLAGIILRRQASLPGLEPEVASLANDPTVRAAAERFVDGIRNVEGLESVTISTGGHSTTIKGRGPASS